MQTQAQRWYVAGGAYRLNANPEAMDAEDKKNARAFVKQFNTLEPITEELTLYRGIGTKKGYRNQSSAYWSSSTSCDVAESYTATKISRVNYDYVMEIVGEVLIMTVEPGVVVMNIGGPNKEMVIDGRNVCIKETMRVKNDNAPEYIWLTISPK